MFEHLFFNQIKNISYSLDQEIKAYHFRTLLGKELDFIFKIKNKNIIVELKSTEPNSDEVKKIESICKEFNLGNEIYIACLKCKAKKIGSVVILPWQEVLKDMTERLK